VDGLIWMTVTTTTTSRIVRDFWCDVVYYTPVIDWLQMKERSYDHPLCHDLVSLM
jgi:hypothetical protein